MKPKVLHTNRYYVTISLLTLCCGTVIAYMYFLSLSVVHVVMKKEIERQSQQVLSEIAQLESDYIEAHHRISQKVAQIDGFSAVSEKTFVSRNVEQGLVLRTGAE